VRDVAHPAARLSVAEGIVRALALAREGKLASAFALLDATERLAKAAAKAFNDNELAERAKSIGPVRKTLPSLVPPPEPPEPLATTGGPTMPRPPRAAPAPVHVPPAVLQTQADAIHTLQ
jgi:hypothetical protein